ncbi:MAG: hypothetical protein JWM59_4324 [Verrucomicrobiales bacterium]|nr:hypothetical protein [Verrucomicrobiales bacterium]
MQRLNRTASPGLRETDPPALRADGIKAAPGMPHTSNRMPVEYRRLCHHGRALPDILVPGPSMEGIIMPDHGITGRTPRAGSLAFAPARLSIEA